MSLFKKLSVLVCVLSFAAAHSFEPVEARLGYYLYTDKHMREVYNNGGFEIQLNSAYPLEECLHLYGSIGYQRASGRSNHFHQKTTIWQIPLDIGVKKYFSFNETTNWFVALGPRLFYVHQRNHSDYVNKTVSKTGLGLFINAGLDFYCLCSYKLTLFTEYSYQPIHPSTSKQGVETRKVNVGGFCFGVGISW